MKKHYLVGATISALLLASCGGADPSKEQTGSGSADAGAEADHANEGQVTLTAEQIAAVIGQLRGIDDRLPQGRSLLEVDLAGLRTDEPARDLHLRRFAAAQHDRRRTQDEKRLSVHLFFRV